LDLLASSCSSDGIISILTKYFYHTNPVMLEKTDEATEFQVISAKGKNLNILVKNIKGKWYARNL
jgi:hypothetical protein